MILGSTRPSTMLWAGSVPEITNDPHYCTLWSAGSNYNDRRPTFDTESGWDQKGSQTRELFLRSSFKVLPDENSQSRRCCSARYIYINKSMSFLNTADIPEQQVISLCGDMDSQNRRGLGNTRYSGFDPKNPTDSAVLRIVEMGFTPPEARNALQKTDNGVNHCIYLAVEYLLGRRWCFTTSQGSWEASVCTTSTKGSE